MAQVMLDKEQLFIRDIQIGENLPLDPQFLVEPGDHGFAKNLPGLGKRLERREQDPLELEQRLLVEDHVVEILSRDPGLFQTKVNCL